MDGQTSGDSKDQASRGKNLGTTFTFVAFCYKHDICISKVVTQNTLKCAISRAKFQKFSGEGHSHPSGRGHTLPPSGLRHSSPVQKSWIRLCSRMVTVLAWTAEAPGFESWFGYVSRVGMFFPGRTWHIELICAEIAVKHRSTTKNKRKLG